MRRGEIRIRIIGLKVGKLLIWVVSISPKREIEGQTAPKTRNFSQIPKYSLNKFLGLRILLNLEKLKWLCLKFI